MASVRNAVVSDAERIAEIHVRSWQKAYQGILPADFLQSLSIEARAERWRSDLEAMNERNVALVIEDGPTVSGFARLAPSAKGSEGELQAIYLHPDSWRMGLGRILLKAAEEVLRDCGWTEAILWVLENNEAARRFYEASGWQAEPRHALLNIGGADVAEIRYRKDLEP
jgi:GNAT superfamily N-acetyltransferase